MHYCENKRYLPALQPNSPGIRVFSRICGKRTVLFFEGPEEESVVWMISAIDWDVASPITPQGESDIRQWLCHLEICMAR